MMWLKLLFITIFGITFLACKNTSSENEKKVEQILGDGKDYQDLIRNPVSADGVLDTARMAWAAFDEVQFDFGTIEEGEVVTHDFTFKNAGSTPLLIQEATSTCGCTVPEVPKDPVEPGESGKITVKYNSEGRVGHQNKTITIFTNGYPARYSLAISVNVEKE